jgi:hypothetical protein
MSSLAEPKPPAQQINDTGFVTHIHPVFTEEMNRGARDKHKQINWRRKKNNQTCRRIFNTAD